MAPCPCLNRNWWSGMILFSSRMGSSLFRNSFSSILDRMASRLIGLYEPSSASGLPGLCMRITSAHFHWEGKCPSRIGSSKPWGTLCSSLGVAWGQLRRFVVTRRFGELQTRDLIQDLLTTYLWNRQVHRAGSANELVRLSYASSSHKANGWKLVSRWSANASAFSWIDRHHIPAAVLTGGVPDVLLSIARLQFHQVLLKRLTPRIVEHLFELLAGSVVSSDEALLDCQTLLNLLFFSDELSASWSP